MSTVSFICAVCKKVFKANKTLRQHVRLFHAGAELPAGRPAGRKRAVVDPSVGFKCTQCDEIFGNKSSLKSHRRSRHRVIEAAGVRETKSGSSGTSVCGEWVTMSSANLEFPNVAGV